MSLITIILFVCGIYLIYSTVKMKASGEIPKGMINNKINLNRSKDIPGYIKHMYPRGIAFGCMICLFSGVLIINDLGIYSVNPIILLIVQLGYIASIVYYSVVSVKAQNKYLF